MERKFNNSSHQKFTHDFSIFGAEKTTSHVNGQNGKMRAVFSAMVAYIQILKNTALPGDAKMAQTNMSPDISCISLHGMTGYRYTLRIQIRDILYRHLPASLFPTVYRRLDPSCCSKKKCTSQRNKLFNSPDTFQGPVCSALAWKIHGYFRPFGIETDQIFWDEISFGIKYGIP